MQQEDDLRALAKIMEFGRAVSIFILVVHVYVYCYPSMSAWHLNLDVIDRILMNFDRTTGIFGCILWTKLMAVLLLAISCMGWTAECSASIGSVWLEHAKDIEKNLPVADEKMYVNKNHYYKNRF